MIESAETFHNAVPGVSPAEAPIVFHGDKATLRAMVEASDKQLASGAHGEINHGRWIVKCPNPDCSGAHYASLTDPRFFCKFCHNRAFGGRWLRVKLPSEDQRKVIERLLLARPNVADRNFRPEEKVIDLIEENRENGIEATA